MEYQYEAANVAQMNIYWIFVYTFFILLTTYVSSRLMRAVSLAFVCFINQNQQVDSFTEQRNGNYHS